MKEFYARVDKLWADNLPGWCTLQRAYAMASVVFAIRPEIVLEIGVFGGRSFLPMAMALKEIGKGMAIGIDPWSAADSSKDQIHPADKKFWGELDHEAIYQRFTKEVFNLGLSSCVRILRQRSDQAPLPPFINVLSVDGDHCEQAYHDMKRYGPLVTVGGFAIVDDEKWTGNYGLQGTAFLEEIGFKRLYELDGTVFLQRLRA